MKTKNKTTHSKFKNKKRLSLTILLITLLTLFLCSIIPVIAYKYLPVKWTPLMTIRRIEAHQSGKEITIRHEWRDMSQISPYLAEAVIVGEDDLFYKHNGFSRNGIKRAIKEHKESGIVKHGGSTISQQTAKNVFCTNHRNIFRKCIEAYYTILIEIIWDKNRIMEVYLNSIEMGDGIFGAEAAAQIYFHHSARQLTLSEACLISACIPNPRKWSITNPGPYVRSRQQVLINRCKKKAYAQPTK